MRARPRGKQSIDLSRFKPPQAVVIAGGLIAIVAFLVGYGVTALAYTSGAAPSDVVLVPDVRELSLTEAARRMSDNGLNLLVGDSLPNSEVVAGAILTQTPLPGQEVSPGTEVSVIVSTGQLKPIVPDVYAMSLTMATRALQTAGFDILIEEAPGEGEPGRVISIDPPAGTPVPLPDTVVVRVGALPPFVNMPEVTGMQEEEARIALEALGLRVTEVFYESSDSVPPYQVIEQIPLAGDSIAPGDAVRLRVTLPQVIRSQGRIEPRGTSAARTLSGD